MSVVKIFNKDNHWWVETSDNFIHANNTHQACLQNAIEFCKTQQLNFLQNAGIAVEQIRNSGVTACYAVIRGNEQLFTFNSGNKSVSLGVLNGAICLLTQKGYL